MAKIAKLSGENKSAIFEKIKEVPLLIMMNLATCISSFLLATMISSTPRFL
jgi:hypothetical protein